MFARNLKPNSVAEFTQTIEKEVIPLLRKQEGFQDEITFVAPGRERHLQTQGRSQMADKIKTGTILIGEGALLPDSLRFESEPYSNGWRLVKNLDGYGLDRKIRDAGWTFFSMAVEIKASVFGFDGEKAVRRAVNRVLANLKWEKSNCRAITQVAAKRFLGLPYVTVSAHPRHIQESVFYSTPNGLGNGTKAKLAAV